MEYANICIECQKRHLKEVKKPSFDVICSGIPKKLWEENHFPLEEIIDKETYFSLTEDEIVGLQYKYNKALWAKDCINWSTFNEKRNFEQFYQKELLLCTAKRKVGRLGRRMGKSEVLSVDALHFACNNPGKTVMILTPFQNTADELYDRMCGLLESEFSIYRANFKKKAKPNKITIFIDGKKSVIKMFTTGTKSGSEGASTRGQKADRIYFDETAYFTNKDIETVYALALESEDVEIIAFSTPTALKTLYRQWCQSEPNWRDFHFPSTILPNWENVKKEMERTYDEQGFAQEILAEFFESSGKVFMTDAINAALRDYKYTEKLEDVENFEQYICTMGVDWNEWKNGRMYAVLCGNT